MMSASSWPRGEPEEEDGPIDFSRKPSTPASDSPTDLSQHKNHIHHLHSQHSSSSNRQSPAAESESSAEESKPTPAAIPAVKSNGYKWKKAKTTISSSSPPSASSPTQTAASAAAVAAMAAYNMTTPSPSPPEATASSLSLLTTALPHNSTSEVLCRLLQSSIYNNSQAMNGGSGIAKLTSLPGLMDSMSHQGMDGSSTSENDDTLSPRRMDMNGSVSVSSGGTSSASRKKGRPLPEELKDDAYWERRRKNNEAAKRSRDARRAKEYEVAIKATILEQENLKLRVENASLKADLARLRCQQPPYPGMQQQLNNANGGNRKSRDNCCRHDHD